MKKPNLLSRFYLFILVLLIGCSQRAGTNTPQSSQSTLQHPDPTTFITSEPNQTTILPMTNTITPTSSVTLMPTFEPHLRLQLTFQKEKDGNRVVYAIPLDCPTENILCVGEPEVLFSFDSPITSLQWSPDGEKAVIAALGDGGRDDIFVFEINSNQVDRITKTPDYEGNPIWIPNENRIEFETCVVGESCKFISTNLDGKDILTEISEKNISSGLTLGELSFSIDGRKIVFSGSISEPYYGIFAANPDGSDLIRLTSPENYNHHSPIFSPDGQWIAFIRDFDPNPDRSDIFLIHPDGTGERNLTNGLTPTQMFLDWSPDGDWIAFNGCFSLGRCDLFIIKPDGLTSINLSNREDWQLLGWRAYWEP